MHIFRCDRCGHVVDFSAHECGSCGAELGYVSERQSIAVLATSSKPATFEIDTVDGRFWRCLNAAWGCNWMLPADSDTPWCRSCRLTRGRPDEARPDAVAAWMIAEAAKRRLVHQLDTLGLPIEGRSSEDPDGLAFDLVHLPGEGGITGHSEGVVTLDLAETDDRHRDELRVRLNEPFRTVIGHLRHEIGHHYWSVLVRDRGCETSFRRLFGDERVDYRTAVEAYYVGNRPAWDPTVHVTAYAASHPLEDWAETFAHYLHVVDGLDTAIAYGLAPAELGADPDVAEILDVWRPVNVAITAVAAAVGMPPIYPFDPTGVVVDKLAFVHDRVTHPFVTTRKETSWPPRSNPHPVGTTESPRSRS
jgi:hypothetical protein